jgi:hypothetical protein
MNTCCTENLIILSSTQGGTVTLKGQSHVAKTTIHQCTVCKRKHYGMEAEPAMLKMEVNRSSL